MDYVTEADQLLQINCRTFESLEKCGEAISVSNSQFKILTFNIRSIQKNFNEFTVTLSRLKLTFDVIVLTECWLTEEIYIPVINGYHSHRTKKFINKSGGVVVYVSDSRSANVSEPLMNDCNCLKISISPDVNILGIYRSPSFSLIDEFLTSLEAVLREGNNSKIMIVAGDLNLDISNNPLSEQCSEYLCLLTEHLLLPAITKPTRGLACLDHIFVKNGIGGSGFVVRSGITDHDLCILGLPSIKINENPPKRTKTITDHTAIVSNLKSADWSTIFNSNDVDSAATFLVNTLDNAIRSNTKNVVCSRTKYTIKPWITPGLIKCQRNRDFLHLQVRKDPNNLILQVTYKRYRNFLTNLLHKLKSNYENELLLNSKNDPKKLWHNIKSICNISKTKNDATSLLCPVNPVKSLNACNEYFSNIGKTLADNTLNKLNTSEDTLAAEVNDIKSPVNSLFFLPTDEKEVYELIQNLRLGSSPGFDGYTPQLIKLIHPYIVAPLTHIFNLSLLNGKFPNVWKLGVVSPIHKDGDKTSPSNFRPITLLSIFSKLLEKIVNKRLVQYLENKSLLNDKQFGFRRNKSTEDAVVLLTKRIAHYLDDNKCCLGVFLDLAKAFDTVSVPILLQKLASMGIRGITLEWFRSYLTNRRLCVKVGSLVSEQLPIKYGVPQGSILGPTLFIIYMNDIFNIPNLETDLICYADDTVILFHDESWDAVKKTAEKEMSKIALWLSKNLLTLNVKKTKYLTFCKTRISSPPKTYKLSIHTCSPNETPLSDCNCPPTENVNMIKYLGVLVDKNLSFKDHISSLAGKIRKTIFIVKSLRKSAPKYVLTLVYKALCQSALTYCLLAWGGVAKTTLRVLETAQRAVLKVMLGKPRRFPTNELYYIAKVLRVRQLFISKVSTVIHKLTVSSKDFATLTKQRRYKIPIPTIRSTFARRLPPYSHSYIYNKACNQIQNMKNLSYNKLKKEVECWLTSLDYDETEDIIAACN